MPVNTKIIVAMTACCIISACAMLPMSRDSGAAAEVGAHPIYTAVGGFYATSMTLLGLQSAPSLYFDDPKRPQILSAPQLGSGCVPHNLASYQAGTEAWKPENRDRFECRHMTLVPMPIGTAIQVDSVMKTWDFENGTQYLVSAHLADPSLPQRDFEIERYLLLPGRRSADDGLHLNPRYFTAEPPKAAQP